MSMRLHEAPDVLTPAQVAELLGMGRTATYQALRAGELPGARVGGRWLVPKPALLERLGVEADPVADPAASPTPGRDSPPGPAGG